MGCLPDDPDYAVLRSAARVLCKSGDDFFPAVVAELASMLNAEFAIVGELTPDGRSRTVAAWPQGAMVADPEYDLAGTPCEGRTETSVYHPRGVRARFPSDTRLAEVGAEGYVGTTLLSAEQEPIGVIEIVTRAPVLDGAPALALLHILAGRTAVEIQRLRAERERRQAEHHLLQVQRVDAIGRLAGGIAHDFNNLMMIVVGYGEILRARQDSPELAELLAAADRAIALTRQLLAFGRRQVFQIERVDLNAVVTRMQAMLTRAIGAHVRLTTSLDRELPGIEADAGQMEQILVNLAINARDAMPEGGTLLIETSLAEVREGYRQMPAGRYVRLSVTDSGIGMPPEVLAQIFEPFYTTKGDNGTGLGLSSVYGIVKQSGGYIWCRSETGRGTTFDIYLPPSQAAPPPERNVEVVPDRDASGTEKVLVVDDEPAVRALLHNVLHTRGYVVSEAPDARAALTVLQEMDGDVDLVVSDVVMPGMSGVQLAGEIGRRWPRMKVLLISGHPLGESVHAGTPALQVPFAGKPFTPTHIAAKVRDVLDA